MEDTEAQEKYRVFVEVCEWLSVELLDFDEWYKEYRKRKSIVRIIGRGLKKSVKAYSIAYRVNPIEYLSYKKILIWSFLRKNAKECRKDPECIENMKKLLDIAPQIFKDPMMKSIKKKVLSKGKFNRDEASRIEEATTLNIIEKLVEKAREERRISRKFDLDWEITRIFYKEFYNGLKRLVKEAIVPFESTYKKIFG